MNIRSYWAEHKGRIPISKVCGRPWAVSCLPGSMPGPPPRARPLSPARMRVSHRGDLLALQPEAIQEQSVDGVPRASSLQRRGRDVQEVLGVSRGDKTGLRPLLGVLAPKEGEW